MRRSTGIVGRAISRMRGRTWHSFLSFDKNIANIVSCNVYGISDSGHAEYTLHRSISESITTWSLDSQTHTLTSVEPGSIPSLAFNLAPLASCISLILEPCLPMTDPMREFGIMNLMVTARLPWTEGTSNGSSLMRRTMRPNACRTI